MSFCVPIGNLLSRFMLPHEFGQPADRKVQMRSYIMGDVDLVQQAERRSHQAKRMGKFVRNVVHTVP